MVSEVLPSARHLPAGEVDGLDAGLGLLHGLAAGDGAQTFDAVIAAFGCGWNEIVKISHDVSPVKVCCCVSEPAWEPFVRFRCDWIYIALHTKPRKFSNSSRQLRSTCLVFDKTHV
jgi:hypothetical protein